MITTFSGLPLIQKCSEDDAKPHIEKENEPGGVDWFFLLCEHCAWICNSVLGSNRASVIQQKMEAFILQIYERCAHQNFCVALFIYYESYDLCSAKTDTVKSYLLKL